MQKQILTAHNLAIGIHHELIFNINMGVKIQDRIGVIGANGSGKTTFLKTIAKLQDPFGGSLSVSGSCYYVPQIQESQTWNDLTLERYSISSGISTDSVIKFLAEEFGYTYEKEKPMSQLSGGQQSLIVLACGFLKSPDILLLDEPTNHLDVDAKKVLIELIHDFKGVIICVSHDAWFLAQITNHLWIIQDETVRVFTGSYQEYQAELMAKENSRERKLEAVKKEKQKLKIAKEREAARALRSERVGREHRNDRSTDRGALGFFGDNAERIKGKKKHIFDAKTEIISTKIKDLSSDKKKKVSGNITTNDIRGGLIHIKDASLFVQQKQLLEHISFDMKKGDRISISGKNGSGKSALMKAILGKSDYVLEPKPYRNPSLRFEYLDQHYSIINPEKSVLDNAVDFSGEQMERVRQHLSHFLFSDSHEVLKKAKYLSGGMLARLAFVMLTITPIDLLILDEPTNNLDLETIEAIQKLLLGYRGGLIVISHDLEFVRVLDIQESYIITEDQRFLIKNEER